MDHAVAIRIVFIKFDENGNPLPSTKRVYQLNKDAITIGSSSQCDVCLDDHKGIEFSIKKSSDSSYYLDKQNCDSEIKVNTSAIDRDHFSLKNGDEIQLENYGLRFCIEFSSVGRNSRVGLISRISTVLIISIVILEFSIIAILPKQVEKRQIWELEVMRQRTLDLVDSLRNRCHLLSKSGKKAFYLETVQLIQNELDKIAVYLRRYASKVEMEEISRFYKDISYFQTILNKLDTNELYPAEITLDIDAHINAIFEENEESQKK